MLAWFKLSKEEKQGVIARVAYQKGFNEQVVEKDIWVTTVLEALFSLPDISKHLVFKGGTSLSKGYNLIQRFSEDIDFAIDRNFLGFSGDSLNKGQVEKLRRESFKFTKNNLAPQLLERLWEMGVPKEEFTVRCDEVEASDADPLPINIEYNPLTGSPSYLADKVILEVGARSLMEPAENKKIQSFVAEFYGDKDFAGKPFEISTVLPTRTFLEKLFLIHEQFLLKEIRPPKNRMSRHLYDIEKLMNTKHAKNALNDRGLFEHIVAHRRDLNPVRGITYDKHIPSELNIIPPKEIIGLWEKDYAQFIEHMVVGDKLHFGGLIERLTQLQKNIRDINWK